MDKEKAERLSIAKNAVELAIITSFDIGIYSDILRIMSESPRSIVINFVGRYSCFDITRMKTLLDDVKKCPWKYSVNELSFFSLANKIFEDSGIECLRGYLSRFHNNFENSRIVNAARREFIFRKLTETEELV